MGTVISNLKARFGVDTSDFKKGLKEGDKALDDFQGAAGAKLDEFASLFGVNMGAVNDAIGTAFKALNFVGESLGGVAAGGKKASIAMNLFKTALIGTGIGAIVVALGSLITYFQKSGEGADKFAKILAQVKSVFDNVIERLVQFGAGLADIFSGNVKEGLSKIGDAFKGIGKEIKEDWKASGELAEEWNKLEDTETALLLTTEERRQKIAELREEAAREGITQREKLALLQEAEDLTKKMYADQVALEQKRLELMSKQESLKANDLTAEQIKNENEAIRLLKEKLGLQGKDITDEKLKELTEQLTKVNQLYASQANEIRAIERVKKPAAEAVREEIELEKMKAEQIAITRVATDNIRMPDLSQVSANILVPLQAVQTAMQGMKDTMIDVTSVFTDAFTNITVGFSEMAGNLFAGGEGMRGWGTQLVGNTFGDMLINLGKVAIAAGIGIEAIKAAFASLGGIGAIMAGGMLIALGSAIKATISATFAASPASATTDTGNKYTYDTRGSTPQTFKISGQVEVVARGPDLVGVIDIEQLRKDIST